MQAHVPDVFDHDWGPCVNWDDFKSLFHFEFEGEDNKKDIYGFMDSDESMKSFSSEVKPERGSIAQRRAAKLGFDDSRIHVAQFKNNHTVSSLSSCSSFFTVPSGISPAALLESPVMLPNSQPSPTTGTFPQASFNHDPLTVKSVDISGTDDDEGKGSSGAAATDTSAKFFKCPACDLTTQSPSASSAENKSQARQSSKIPSDYRKSEASIKECDMSKSPKAEVGVTWDATDHDVDKKPCIADTDNQIHRLKACIDQKETVAATQVEEQKVKGLLSVPVWTRNAGDGYCWRKYGQKHVKGSEYPRSYYRCNNTNCYAKKKVERSNNGEITEIIYKGVHNHPRPQPRLSLGRQFYSAGDLLETGEGWRTYGYERTSSTTFLNGIPDPIAAIGQGNSGYVFGGSVETSELGSTMGIREGGDEDNRATHQGSTSPGDGADGDESEPKRRKKEIFSGEACMPSRSTREPRIVLQMPSEIDVVEDGYRWRKYGQKVVKGNPNPRSYYKCTSAGCPVRKHVERASEDIKSVITTYEGKHNHLVPTAKTTGTTTTPTTTTTTTNCGSSSSSLGNSPSNGLNPHPMLAIPRNHHNVLTKPEIQVQELPLHYQQMKPNEFSQPKLLEGLVGDMKLGHPSIYHQIKFPHSLHYNPFVNETQTSCIPAGPVMPDFAMAGPLSMPGSAKLSVSNGFLPSNHSSSVQSSVGDQQMNENNDLMFFKPKEEQKDDHFYESYPSS